MTNDPICQILAAMCYLLGMTLVIPHARSKGASLPTALLVGIFHPILIPIALGYVSILELRGKA